MQDRYAGDVGDYGKIGLLKCLQTHGFTIGVNWYRVPTLDSEKKNDGTYKQQDGKYLVPPQMMECDPQLADIITNIAQSKKRSVAEIQKADLVPGAIYFDDFLTLECRHEWHEKALKRFKDADLVFMDPDNGLLVKSVGKSSARSIKYVFYEEVKDFIDAGKSVLVYNHRCRKPEKKYFDDIKDRLYANVKINIDLIQTITFSKGTTRDYIAIPASKKHFDMFKDAFDDMRESMWGKLGVCR